MISVMGYGFQGQGQIEVRFGGQIPIQDSLISGETPRSTKLGSDPQTVLPARKRSIQQTQTRRHIPVKLLQGVLRQRIKAPGDQTWWGQGGGGGTAG
jgi:hypothetical protein